MTGAASALFLLDIKGRVLIWRDYRGDVSAVEAERFFTKLIEKEVRFTFFLLLSSRLAPIQLSTSHTSIISALFNILILFPCDDFSFMQLLLIWWSWNGEFRLLFMVKFVFVNCDRVIRSLKIQLCMIMVLPTCLYSIAMFTS